MALSCLGCRAPGYDARPDVPRAVHTPLDATVPDHASVAQWQAPPQRLAEDIGRTLVAMEWGVGSVLTYRDPDDQPPLVVRAMALLADNRSVTVVGRQVDEQTVSVAIQVGSFGSPQVEQQFLEQLQQTLAGEPASKRTWRFKLPE